MPGSSMKKYTWLACLGMIVQLCALSSITYSDELRTQSPPAHLDGAIFAATVTSGDFTGLLVQYDDNISFHTDDAVLFTRQITPLETLWFSSTGMYLAIAAIHQHHSSTCDLTLIRFDGTVIWNSDNIPAGRIHISDDGSSVVALNGINDFGGKSIIVFYDSDGRPINSLEGLAIRSEGAALSPNGQLFVTAVKGDASDGVVSMDDQLMAYNNRGELLWQETAFGLHFAGQIQITGDRVFASFYADSGRKHFINIYDTNGREICQVDPQIPNYGAYHLRVSASESFLMAYGHHHLVMIDANDGKILWEWEWSDADDESLLYDCLLIEEADAVIAAAFSGKLGRVLMAFDESGNLVGRQQYSVKKSDWDDLRLFLDKGKVFLLDNGCKNNLQILR